MTAVQTTDAFHAHLAACLQAATAAPSVHNGQPWRFRISHDRIDVIWDTTRILPANDPHGREALISVGAAVLNLRVAILAAGRIPLTRLLPDPDAPDLAAQITIGAAHTPDATIRALDSAISKRRTNRRPFRDIEVRDEIIDQLVAAARTEGATLMVTDDIGRQAILGLVRTSSAFGPTDDSEGLPLRDFGLTHDDVPRRQARFETAPTMVVLYTASDGPVQWLRAGQAMQRVLLTATVRGVSNTPMTAPTEIPELRALLSGADDDRVAQVILRLGYGDPCPATPRRPLNDVTEYLAA